MLRPGLQLLARFKTGQPDSKPANPFRNRLGWAVQFWQFYACAIDATRVSDRYSSSCDE